jgi:hypothetical protein
MEGGARLVDDLQAWKQEVRLLASRRLRALRGHGAR